MKWCVVILLVFGIFFHGILSFTHGGIEHRSAHMLASAALAGFVCALYELGKAAK